MVNSPWLMADSRAPVLGQGTESSHATAVPLPWLFQALEQALFLPRFENLKWRAFQNTPEMKTFVSRIALIFALCDGGLWQSQTSDLTS